MALTRKALKAMGLTEEQVDSIVEMHSETVDGLKADVDRYKADAGKLADVQRQLDDLKATAETGYKDKYDKEHTTLPCGICHTFCWMIKSCTRRSKSKSDHFVGVGYPVATQWQMLQKMQQPHKKEIPRTVKCRGFFHANLNIMWKTPLMNWCVQCGADKRT